MRNLELSGVPIVFDPRLRPDEFFFAPVTDGQIFLLADPTVGLGLLAALWAEEDVEFSRWADDGGREPPEQAAVVIVNSGTGGYRPGDYTVCYAGEPKPGPAPEDL